MWNNVTEAIVTIVLAFVGLAVVATLVSGKANTVGVFQAGASGVANNIAVAESPVTGDNVQINTSYPSSNLSMGFGS
jgi:PRD1 phage membrane DNA delivery